MALDSKQKAVVRSGVPAVILATVAVFASLSIPLNALPADEPGARIVWALQWALLPMLALMIMVMRVANHRFFSPEDINGSGLTVGSKKINVLRAVLQNTLEQSLLAVLAYAIAAVTFAHDWLRIIPAAAGLFAIGRILFALGYERGAGGRAAGFGLTAYPTFALLVTAATLLALRLVSWVAG
jgi:hypothetical protein